MNTPSCNSCGTDSYIKILNYKAGYVDVTEHRVGGGQTITKQNPVGPVAQFLCQKCGYSNGHTVADDWEPKAGPSEEDLIKLGSWYKGPGHKITILPDGSRMETM